MVLNQLKKCLQPIAKGRKKTSSQIFPLMCYYNRWLLFDKPLSLDKKLCVELGKRDVFETHSQRSYK